MNTEPPQSAAPSPQPFSRALIDEILAAVRENHPTYLQADEVLRNAIRAGLKRARAHGLSDHRSLVEYVLVMFEIAPNFDQQPVLAQVLSDPRLPTEERWEKIFEEDYDDAWHQAAEPGFHDSAFWRDPDMVSPCPMARREEHMALG